MDPTGIETTSKMTLLYSPNLMLTAVHSTDRYGLNRWGSRQTAGFTAIGVSDNLPASDILPGDASVLLYLAFDCPVRVGLILHQRGVVPLGAGEINHTAHGILPVFNSSTVGTSQLGRRCRSGEGTSRGISL